MIRYILLATLIAGPALAKNPTPPPFQQGGSSQASASASAGAVGIGHGGVANAQGGDARSTQTVNVDASSRDRLQAPGLGVPGLAIGNNCGLGASAGVSGPGFAIGGAYSWEGDTCSLIALAGAARLFGRDAVGIAILCQDPRFSEAMRLTGEIGCPRHEPGAGTTAVSGGAVVQASAPASRACVLPTPEELRTGLCR